MPSRLFRSWRAALRFTFYLFISSDVDYDMITEGGRLTNERGAIAFGQFREIMHLQVVLYIKRKLQRSVSEADTQETFSHLAAIKFLMNEVDRQVL
jgi:hypothetical protein